MTIHESKTANVTNLVLLWYMLGLFLICGKVWLVRHGCGGEGGVIYLYNRLPEVLLHVPSAGKVFWDGMNKCGWKRAAGRAGGLQGWGGWSRAPGSVWQTAPGSPVRSQHGVTASAVPQGRAWCRQALRLCALCSAVKIDQQTGAFGCFALRSWISGRCGGCCSPPQCLCICVRHKRRLFARTSDRMCTGACTEAYRARVFISLPSR